MMQSLCVCLLVLVTVAHGWPYDDEFSSWRLARTSRRSQRCISSGSKCFSTSQCCHGFVCAAFDDLYGSSRRPRSGANPEMPGVCVKEKDLQLCDYHSDCSRGDRCVSLGRSGEKYCQDTFRSFMEPELEQEPVVVQPSAERVRGYSMKAGGNGLGDACTSNSDCQPFDKNRSQLCCQKVSRGRQGSVKMCDRVTPISKCIAD